MFYLLPDVSSNDMNRGILKTTVVIDVKISKIFSNIQINQDRTKLRKLYGLLMELKHMRRQFNRLMLYQH